MMMFGVRKVWKILKRNVVPSLVVFFAATVVVLVSIPLAQTEWAEGVRAGFGDQPSDGNDTGAPGVAIYILPLIKVAVLMSIGGLVTSLVSRTLVLFLPGES